MTTELTVWTNAEFPEQATRELAEGTRPHRLLRAAETSSLNLVSAPPDALLREADIAFGQPDVSQLFDLPRLRWVHLTTAGYTAYDRDDLREHFRQRSILMTNSSSVYAEPCAQHALAMIVSFARQLPLSLREQDSNRAWSYVDIRYRSFLLNGQTVLIYGYGTIARRLCQLLAPFGMKLIGVRRSPEPHSPIPIIQLSDHLEYLRQADHVVNILPASEETRLFFDEPLLQQLKPTAHYYNIGRGTTVDQMALSQRLRTGQLAGAYLDVTDPEPLPRTHPLWDAPNCFITPHTAGGFREEMSHLVQHFLNNLHRFQHQEPLENQII